VPAATRGCGNRPRPESYGEAIATTILTTRIVVAALMVALAGPPQATACTAFQLTAGDGARIYCRSMEFGFAFDSKVLIVPRGTEYTGTAPGGRPGLKWRARHGVVGLNANLMPNMVADGMNEQGPVVGMLYLPGYSEYLPPDDAQTARTLASWEVGIYVLSTCAAVAETVISGFTS